MPAEEDNPVLKAVPPETDYITYLTILEYQLTVERLPSLLKVLQDDTLTENIGWDLVHLLVPMLPASKECLDLIARKGNPREVIIRVTEYLDTLVKDAEVQDQSSNDGGLPTFQGEAERIHLGDMVLDGMPQPEVSTGAEVVEESQSNEDRNNSIAFTTLLSMLAILHPRIKTKFPSRFLATSLPPALAAYRRNITTETTLLFLDFIKTLSGRKKPVLPPRGASETSTAQVQVQQVSLPDPEGDLLSEPLSADEKALIHRLFQAVVLEICEDYVDSLTGEYEGLAWSTRVRESTFPDKLVPGSTTCTERFRREVALQQRNSTMEKILETCLLLGLHPNAVINDLIPSSSDDLPHESAEDPGSPSEYPTSPKDIPFSATGSLAFLAAYKTSPICHPAVQAAPVTFDGLSVLSELNGRFLLGDSFMGNSQSVIDALLAINLRAVAGEDLLTASPSFDQFLSYAKPFINLSADSPDPQWRYTSHVLVQTALTSHPDEKVRLEMIRSFLKITESGPRLLLKGSSISWLKNEILRAQSLGEGEAATEARLFADPNLITGLSDEIFWDISAFSNTDAEILSMVIAPTLSAIASILNFYYFLASSPLLRKTFHLSSKLEGDTSEPTQAAAKFVRDVEELLKRVQDLDEDVREGVQRDVMVIESRCLDTEIDWSTYMQHIQLYLKDERDYAKIEGDTGPLVYPGLHVYIYSVLYYLTENGTSIFKAQVIFACLYLVTLSIVFSCYRKVGAPPYLLIPLVLSKRIHSIFLLRLFNDAWAVLFFWLSVWFLQRKRWMLGGLTWAAAVGVKMTVLLTLPAVGAIILQGAGQREGLIIGAVATQLQLAIGLPFMVNGNAKSYLTRAFQLDRQFLYKWTVNWKMMTEELFLSRKFSRFLLAYHVLVLALFINDRWLKPSSTSILDFLRQYRNALPKARQMQISKKVTPMFVMEAVLGSMVIGLMCARSLHYQFFVYLGWASPFVLWRTGLRPGMIFFVWVIQEMAWLTYPSTAKSSNMVVGSLAIQALGLWFGSKVPPSEVVGVEEKEASEIDKTSDKPHTE